MKDTYSYESKSTARKKLHDMVLELFPKRKQRESLKVLTLLGHEDHELREIWDPLGIERPNITCVEKLPEVHKLIAGSNLGINLVKEAMTLENYVKLTPLTFDIINIDDVSPFSLPQRDTIRHIAYRRLLGRKGILATWYLGKRENEYAKYWFQHQFDRWGMKDDGKKVKDRSNILSRMICSIMIDGYLNCFPHILTQHPFFSGYSEHLRGTKGYEILKREFNPDYTDEQRFSFLHVTEGMSYMLSKIREILLMTGKKFNDQSLELAARLVYYTAAGSYFSVLQKRYSYIGNNGSPMLVDFNYFKQRDFSHIINLDVKENPPLPIPRAPSTSVDRKDFFDFQIYLARCRGERLAEREFLGSSYTPRKKEPRLDKKEALLLLSSDIPIPEIMEAFPNSFTEHQLRAFKAHRTMGTYEKELSTLH
jgi:hypothetical protein